MPKHREDLEYQPLILWERPRGINTVVPEGLLGLNDAVTAQNLYILPAGGRFLYATRPGLKKITNTAADGGAAIKHMKQLPVNGTSTFLAVDANHKIYKYTGTEPTLEPGAELATLEGATTIVPFNGDAVLLDGSYIKTYDGTSVALAYDDGTGSDGYVYDNVNSVTLDDTKAVDLYSGGTEETFGYITTPAWDAGYTIDTTSVDIWLSKTGSPTGSAYFKLYTTDGGTLLGTSDAFDVSTLTTSATLNGIDFTTAYGLSPSTDYMYSVAYADSDSSNYLTVHGDASGANKRGSDVITNGTFDSDTADWTNESECTLASVAGGVAGNCLEITVSTGSDGWAQQEISVTAGQKRVFSCYYKNGTVAPYVRIRDSDNAAVIKEDLTLTSAAWAVYTVVYTVPAGCTTVQIHLGNPGETAATAYFDNVTDYPIDSAGLAFGLKPGRPPKASFGDVKDSRLYVSNGDGRVRYSNVKSTLDWSTANGGGYIGAVDDDANAYDVGAILAFYSDLYVFGKQAQPYLAKLTGTSPEDYALPPLFQEIYTDHKQINSTLNDICFASGENIHLLSGVQEYGDLRSRGVADQIQDIIRDNWSTTAFTIYNPKAGQFWFCAGGTATTVYVVHLREPIVDEGRGTYYPITTYVFKSLTPTAFGIKDGDVVVGCSNGHIYKEDYSLVTDAGTAFDVELKSGIIITPFGSTLAREMNLPIKSTAAVTATATFYKNGATAAAFTKSVARATNAYQKRINMAFDAFQMKLDTFSFTADVYLGAFLLKIRKLGRWGR